MAFLKSTELIGFKREAVAGTFETSLKTDGINVRFREANWDNTPEKDNESSEYLNGEIFSSDESITAKEPVTVGGEIKLAPPVYIAGTGAGDAQHVNNYVGILESCMLNVQGIGTTVDDEAPGAWLMFPDKAYSAATSSGIRKLEDPKIDTAQLQEGAGLMGNFTISADGTGMPFKFVVEMKGKMVDVEDIVGVTPLNVPYFDESTRMRTSSDVLKNTTITLTNLNTTASHTICVSALIGESGNDVQPVECQDDSSGYLYSNVVKINPSLQIDPLLKAESDFDWWEALRSSNVHYSINIESAYHKIFYPRCQVNSNDQRESNGSMRNGLTWRPLINIDETLPTWFPAGATEPDNKAVVPYYILQTESAPQY